MILLALIGTVWLFCCLVAVALCVAASRADQLLVLVHGEAGPDEHAPEFVAGFTEAAPRAAPAPRVPQQIRR